jgi:hypothetical protein
MYSTARRRHSRRQVEKRQDETLEICVSRRSWQRRQRAARQEPLIDTGGEFGDGRKSRALRHFDSRMRMSLRESRRFLIDNLSFHLILQSMDGHVTSIAPNRPDS